MERRPLGFSPHASDPAVTRDAREDGDRLLSTGLGLRHRHPSALPSTYPLTPSGLVPHYDLSLNRYKEIIHEEVEHRAPAEIMDELGRIEAEIQQGMSELKRMLG